MATASKARKTFSLSRESLKYLESLRKSRRAPSTSAVVEELIRREQQTAEMERVSDSVRRYYDSLTDDEVEEDRAWGQFAESQFPPEDEP
ncbi:MAG TPA: hypothetical protein VLV49_17370 [Terriglobales bacterium]|nr:hypothetical protein [Terriglobales bacterium]